MTFARIQHNSGRTTPFVPKSNKPIVVDGKLLRVLGATRGEISTLCVNGMLPFTYEPGKNYGQIIGRFTRAIEQCWYTPQNDLATPKGGRHCKKDCQEFLTWEHNGPNVIGCRDTSYRRVSEHWWICVDWIAGGMSHGRVLHDPYYHRLHSEDAVMPLDQDMVIISLGETPLYQVRVNTDAVTVSNIEGDGKLSTRSNSKLRHNVQPVLDIYDAVINCDDCQYAVTARAYEHYTYANVQCNRSKLSMDIIVTSNRRVNVKIMTNDGSDIFLQKLVDFIYKCQLFPKDPVICINGTMARRGEVVTDTWPVSVYKDGNVRRGKRSLPQSTFAVTDWEPPKPGDYAMDAGTLEGPIPTRPITEEIKLMVGGPKVAVPPRLTPEQLRELIMRHTPPGEDYFTAWTGGPSIINPELEGVDPWAPDLHDDVKEMIVAECRANPRYFLGIVLRSAERPRTDADVMADTLYGSIPLPPKGRLYPHFVDAQAYMLAHPLFQENANSGGAAAIKPVDTRRLSMSQEHDAVRHLLTTTDEPTIVLGSRLFKQLKIIGGLLVTDAARIEALVVSEQLAIPEPLVEFVGEVLFKHATTAAAMHVIAWGITDETVKTAADVICQAAALAEADHAK